MFRSLNWSPLRGDNQVENIIILIPKGLKKVWDQWKIRSFIIFSLQLQIFLFFAASLRKKTSNKWVIFTIWSAYLLADWAASFAVGLVFDTEEKYTSGPGTVDDTSLLLVLWTPFLLLLLGGQDRITSFAIEDNELWRRHFIWLLLQVFTTGFVFIQSLHQNRLWFPTLLLLLSGTIKYAERTAALYLASSDNFLISLLRKPQLDPPNHRLKTVYDHYKENGFPVEILFLDDEESQVVTYDDTVDWLSDRELVQHAYKWANMYKGLIVNLMFSSRQHMESRKFLIGRSSEQTLRILEIELNYFYDLLHTKVVVAHSKLGKMTRGISFGLVVAALSLFIKDEKQGFKGFDVKLTYALFFSVLGLDLVTHLLWMFSDWTVAYLKKSQKNSLLANIRSKILDKFLDLKKLRLLAGTTPIINRRWSETLSQFNFIYCFHCRKSAKRRKNIITKIFDIITFWVYEYLHITDFMDQKKFDSMQMKYVLHKPLTRNLWRFIFTELEEKSFFADDPEEAKRISSARGDWILENGDFDYRSTSSLMHYVKNVSYDESLLLWHIATELCYNTTGRTDHSDARQSSKLLSDYMFYLLYQQPGMMSEVSGIAKQRFKDTWMEAQRLFSQLESKKLEDTCEKIIEENTRAKPVHVRGGQSKSVLFDACMLAKALDTCGQSKWNVTSKVWVELLSYAAYRSSASAHVQQLSKGGGLLTFVWLLMAHFGLKEQAWVETHTRVKLILNK